jgi:hypothetical protein
VDPAFCRFPRLCRLSVAVCGGAGACSRSATAPGLAHERKTFESEMASALASHLASNLSPPAVDVVPPQAEDFARFVQKEILHCIHSIAFTALHRIHCTALHSLHCIHSIALTALHSLHRRSLT